MDSKKNPAVKIELPQEPYRFQQRHGSTTFLVNVHSSKAHTETAAEIITRLIRNDVTLGKAANQ